MTTISNIDLTLACLVSRPVTKVPITHADLRDRAHALNMLLTKHPTSLLEELGVRPRLTPIASPAQAGSVYAEFPDYTDKVWEYLGFNTQACTRICNLARTHFEMETTVECCSEQHPSSVKTVSFDKSTFTEREAYVLKLMSRNYDDFGFEFRNHLRSKLQTKNEYIQACAVARIMGGLVDKKPALTSKMWHTFMKLEEGLRESGGSMEQSVWKEAIYKLPFRSLHVSTDDDGGLHDHISQLAGRQLPLSVTTKSKRKPR